MSDQPADETPETEESDDAGPSGGILDKIRRKGEAATAAYTEPDDIDAAADHDTEIQIRRALDEIRREGWKIAAIYAVVDATLATLLVNLVTILVDVPVLPDRLSIPGVVLGALRSVGVAISEPTVASGAIIGLVVGAVVFAVEAVWWSRRPLIEQFEAANPSLRESLRTARDAVESDRHSRIVRRLYEDVLDDLRTASSVDLLNINRIAVTVVIISVVSVATIQLAVVDISLLGLGDAPETERRGDTQANYTGLKDGSSILGDPEAVQSGEQELNASIGTSGSGGGGGSGADSAAAYRNSGFSSSTDIESQRAGFDERERLEDAELIREYNLRIRQNSESDNE